jgi:hypothetical protein
MSRREAFYDSDRDDYDDPHSQFCDCIDCSERKRFQQGLFDPDPRIPGDEDEEHFIGEGTFEAHFHHIARPERVNAEFL